MHSITSPCLHVYGCPPAFASISTSKASPMVALALSNGSSWMLQVSPMDDCFCHVLPLRTAVTLHHHKAKHHFPTHVSQTHDLYPKRLTSSCVDCRGRHRSSNNHISTQALPPRFAGLALRHPCTHSCIKLTQCSWGLKYLFNISRISVLQHLCQRHVPTFMRPLRLHRKGGGGRVRTMVTF